MKYCLALEGVTLIVQNNIKTYHDSVTKFTGYNSFEKFAFSTWCWNICSTYGRKVRQRKMNESAAVQSWKRNKNVGHFTLTKF